MSELFEIASDEGLPIRGNFDVPDDPRALAVIVHGFKGFKDWGFFPWLAESLCGRGIAVCRFNMSRSGIGEDPETFDRLDLFAGDTYSIELADLRRAVHFAQLRFGSLPTFLLGHSRGGGIAILGAREVEHLRGVITWNSISRIDRWDAATKRQWRRDGHLDFVNARTRQVMRVSTACLDDVEKHRRRLDIRKAAEKLRVPLLAIHGGSDESVPVSESEEIVSRAADASLVVIGGASHTFGATHPLIDVPSHLSLACTLSAQFIIAHA